MVNDYINIMKQPNKRAILNQAPSTDNNCKTTQKLHPILLLHTFNTATLHVRNILVWMNILENQKTFDLTIHLS